jgi:hypothetical protein
VRLHFWKQFSIDESSKKEFAGINVQAIQWTDPPTCMRTMLLIKDQAWTRDVTGEVEGNVCFMLYGTILHTLILHMLSGKAVATGESIKLFRDMLRYCSEFMIRSNENDPISSWLDTTAHTVIMGAPCTFLVKTWIFQSPEMHILFVRYSIQMEMCLIRKSRDV